MIKRITDELKTIAVSLYDSSRQKSNIIRLLFAFLLIFSGMALSSTHNSIALILIFSGMAICITTYIYRWKSPLRFIILTVFSVIGFPVFVFMHNAFYALGVLSKNIFILKSIFDLIHVVFFILAVVFCPTGLVIGIIGFVAAFLVRLKKNSTGSYSL